MSTCVSLRDCRTVDEALERIAPGLDVIIADRARALTTSLVLQADRFGWDIDELDAAIAELRAAMRAEALDAMAEMLAEGPQSGS
jgi:hypothetical protein